MLKKSITYTDFNGEEITEDFFFHLSKAELVELEMSQKEGLSQYLENIIKAENGQEIMTIFKKLLLQAYGQRSPDGKRFVKNEGLRQEFLSSEAYSELFMELVTDADAAAAFINGIIPATLADDLKKIQPTEETETVSE